MPSSSPHSDRVLYSARYTVDLCGPQPSHCRSLRRQTWRSRVTQSLLGFLTDKARLTRHSESSLENFIHRRGIREVIKD